MKSRVIATVVAATAAVGLSAGFLSLPAGAATSTLTATVVDAGTSTQWSGSEVVGASAQDTAILVGDGTDDPLTGTVTYSFFSTGNDDGACTGTPATVDTLPLNGDGTAPNSSATGPLDAGSYSFSAVYSGGGDNDPSDPTDCEAFSVKHLTATTTTSVVDTASQQGWGSSNEVTGASATDTATVTGVGGTTPTGTVSYSFFDNGTCSGSVPPETVAVNPDGTVLNSSPTGALGGGNYSYDAVYNGDDNYASSAVSSCEPFTVDPTTSSTSATVLDASTNATWAGSEVTGASALATSTVTGAPGFTPSGTVTYSFFHNATCTGGPVSTDPVSVAGGSAPNSSPTPALQVGSYSFQASYDGDSNYSSSPSGCQQFSVGKGTASVSNPVFEAGGGTAWNNTELTEASAQDSATVTGAAGIPPTGSVDFTFFSGTLTCSGIGTDEGTVPIGTDSNATGSLLANDYSFEATYSGDANYLQVPPVCQRFTVAQNPSPRGPDINNAPPAGTAVYGGNFTPTYDVFSDGPPFTTSSTTNVCVVSGGVVRFVGVGPCTVTAHTTGTPNYGASEGNSQSFAVGRATPSPPAISNIPAAVEFGSFQAAVFTNGDGVGSVTSSSGTVCSVGPDGRTVTFVSFGTCTLTAHVGLGVHYLPGTGNPQGFMVSPAARGYWLVGSDGGIFSFGGAAFHGSMGATPLQRPVVGITPTASRNGYWLVASDGGIFSFGDSAFYGSIPGVGLHPAGSGQPNSLTAPIVGMVPSATGHGYFMVASDGGVFAFGDAHFAGSCPGIGGCDGNAVSVMPDSTGMGYWLVTNVGAVYAFGDAANYGEPSAEPMPVVDAVSTPDGRGYWVLYSNGTVLPFGDATGMGAPLGYVNAFNPAAAIFPTADGRGYWIASGRGDVFAYGNAPYLGSEAAAGLNGEIIAAFGF
ncbi:MAG TPA: Ig-like domain-containing protein [Acidimicrobiales bacterium]|nr:Ig-like domain-containing protein [Acidimicrobiales bacterium]